MKPSPTQLTTIVARLRAPIHRRPTPPPKPRGSWQGLKVGAQLTKGPTTWEVVGCNSNGVELRCVAPFKGTSLLYLTDPRDLEGLARVAKPRKARKPKVATT